MVDDDFGFNGDSINGYFFLVDGMFDISFFYGRVVEYFIDNGIIFLFVVYVFFVVIININGINGMINGDDVNSSVICNRINFVLFRYFFCFCLFNGLFY